MSSRFILACQCIIGPDSVGSLACYTCKLRKREAPAADLEPQKYWRGSRDSEILIMTVTHEGLMTLSHGAHGAQMSLTPIWQVEVSGL